MHDDKHAIARHSQVELDRINAQRNRLAQRRHGVFGSECPIAATLELAYPE